MAVDLDTYREESLRIWDTMSSGWEARREWQLALTRPINEWIIEHADPQPGQTVLDIAAGTGDLGFEASHQVGTSGTIITTDFSPDMVDAARRVGEALGISNAQYRVEDAEQLTLDNASVDTVVSRWSYMLMADPARALRETHRVLRPGGRVAFAVWTPPERNPWAALPGMTLVQRGHLPPPEPGAPGIFAMADEQRTRTLVTEAGFDDPLVDEVEFEFRYADFDDVWDALTSFAGPLARAILALEPDEQRATQAAIKQSVEPYRNADGSYATPASCWGVSVQR